MHRKAKDVPNFCIHGTLRMRQHTPARFPTTQMAALPCLAVYLGLAQCLASSSSSTHLSINIRRESYVLTKLRQSTVSDIDKIDKRKPPDFERCASQCSHYKGITRSLQTVLAKCSPLSPSRRVAGGG